MKAPLPLTSPPVRHRLTSPKNICFIECYPSPDGAYFSSKVNYSRRAIPHNSPLTKSALDTSGLV